jgi:hypothetical protein
MRSLWHSSGRCVLVLSIICWGKGRTFRCRNFIHKRRSYLNSTLTRPLSLCMGHRNSKNRKRHFRWQGISVLPLAKTRAMSCEGGSALRNGRGKSLNIFLPSYTTSSYLIRFVHLVFNFFFYVFSRSSSVFSFFCISFLSLYLLPLTP